MGTWNRRSKSFLVPSGYLLPYNFWHSLQPSGPSSLTLDTKQFLGSKISNSKPICWLNELSSARTDCTWYGRALICSLIWPFQGIEWLISHSKLHDPAIACPEAKLTVYTTPEKAAQNHTVQMGPTLASCATPMLEVQPLISIPCGASMQRPHVWAKKG